MIQVLIVEDEKIIRQGIITLINWESLGCKIVGDCSNGVDALSFLKQNKVDLVITDIIMPQSSGLELCQAIHTHYPHIKMLILSSHPDFSYAQEALRYGVSAYIIKTNFIKELPLAITKLCKEIEEERESSKLAIFKEDDLEQIKTMLLESILYTKSIDPKKTSQLISLLGQDLNHYYILFSDLEYMKSPNAEENYYASMLNFYNMAFQDLWHISFWRDSHSIISIVNFQEENYDISLQQLVMQTNKILSTVNNYTSFQLNISVSRGHSSLQELRTAYEETISNLSNLDMENYLTVSQELSSTLDLSTIPSKKEIVKKILSLIRSKELDPLDTYIAELFTYYHHASKRLEQIKIDLLIIMSHCLRVVAEEDVTNEPLENFEERVNTNILQSSSLSGLLKIVTTMIQELNTLTHTSQPHYNTLVLCVNNYIKENYASCIKLNDIAQELHVNSSYLSRLYKSQTGTSIITTLNNYRINQAKELLDTGNYLVSEVACLVGIDDPAYFTNVFTKHVGISPKNYKSK